MRRVDDEQGAVLVMVSVLLTALLGIAALVVDIGALRVEQAELQNGADAAAMAVARACYESPTQTACTNPASLVAGYLNGNATDGTSQVEELAVDRTNKTVRVVAGTREADGSTGMANAFAGVLGHERTEVRATATASWGADVFAPINPFFPIPLCAYNLIKGATGVLKISPDTVWGNNCEQPVPDKANAEGVETKKCNPDECDDWLAILGHRDQVLPILDRSGGRWRLAGWASFKATGFRINGGHQSSGNQCGSLNVCVTGRFTKYASGPIPPAIKWELRWEQVPEIRFPIPLYGPVFPGRIGLTS